MSPAARIEAATHALDRALGQHLHPAVRVQLGRAHRELDALRAIDAGESLAAPATAISRRLRKIEPHVAPGVGEQISDAHGHLRRLGAR